MLIRAAVWYPREFGMMVELPWVEDATITAAETDALYGFHRAPHYAPNHALPLLRMTWAQQEITKQEGEAIKYLYRTARYAPELATLLFGKSWVQDGITTDDLTVIKNLQWIARPEEMDELVWLDAPPEAEYHQMALDIAIQIVEAPWLQDGPGVHETDVVRRLRWMLEDHPELAAKTWQKPWLRDAITRDDLTVLNNIAWIAYPKDKKFAQQTLTAALGILDMPFLKTLSGSDVSAVRSLRKLEGNDTAAFLEIMNNPKLKDGITDEETTLVALLHVEPEWAVHILRDEDRLRQEERTIRLPYSGEVLLRVIRFSDNTSGAMDLLDEYARAVEEYYGEPFPTSDITLAFRDWYAGQYHYGHTGIVMQISSWYDLNATKNSRTAILLPAMLSLYYVNWDQSDQRWINWGLANFMSSSIQDSLGRESRPTGGCSKANTLSVIETLDADDDSVQDCHENMGHRLMEAMHDAIGDQRFRSGIAALHRMTLGEQPAQGCEGTDLTICHVEAAFKAGASDAIAAQVDEVLDRWYGARE